MGGSLGKTTSSVGSGDSRWWNAEANQGRRPEGSATTSQLQSRGSSQSGSRRGGSAQSRHSKHKHTSGNVRWQRKIWLRNGMERVNGQLKLTGWIVQNTYY